MLSTVFEGKVLDWHYYKYTDNGFKFYIGDIFIGILFNIKGSGWTATNWYKTGTEEYKPCKYAKGFKTRYAASEYLLWHNEIYVDED